MRACRIVKSTNTVELRNVSSRLKSHSKRGGLILIPHDRFYWNHYPYNPFGITRADSIPNLRLSNFAIIQARDINTSKLATRELNIYTTDPV